MGYLNRLILIGLLLIVYTIGTISCDSQQIVNIEKSLDVIPEVSLIEGGENATITVNRGADSYFVLKIENVSPNQVFSRKEGDAWCIAWNKPIRSDNASYDGIKLYSTHGSEHYRPINYFLSIKDKLKSEDPELTYKEFQVIIWSLLDFPDFDLSNITTEDLPSRMVENGQYAFSIEKVEEIISLVRTNYNSFTYTTSSFSAVIAETDSDTQTVIIEPDNSIKEKTNQIIEEASTIFPEEIMGIFENRLSIESENKDIEFLDTLDVALTALRDSLEKYNKTNQFQQAFSSILEQVGKQVRGGFTVNDEVNCSNDFRLGYSRAAEVTLDGSAGIGAGIVNQLTLKGGGGVEFIYDFVNMDRGIYTYSICSVGGRGLGIGGGISAGVGFTGLEKYLWNIGTGLQNVEDRFAGVSRSVQVGLAGALITKFGIDASVNLGYGHELDVDYSNTISMFSLCPVAIDSSPKNDSVKEVYFSGSVGAGVGAEIVAALSGEVAGIQRSFVNDSYTNYNESRLNASLLMGAEIISSSGLPGFATTSSSNAAALALIYGFFEPSSCQDPAVVPDVTTKSYERTGSNLVTVRSLLTDSGDSPISSKGICYSEKEFPTFSDNCIEASSGANEFSVTISELELDEVYHVRSYATNQIGTSYGNQLSFKIATPSSDWPRDTETEVVEVTNPETGRVWMDRNLGASRAATSSTDEEAYGDLYQWGRPADGHQKRNSGTTSTLSSSDQPGHGDFIISSGGLPGDWRVPQNNNLWQDSNGINNPCPIGYRVPNEAEWEAEHQSWTTQDASGAFFSPLKLTLAGQYSGVSGAFLNVGRRAYYWSSTIQSGQEIGSLYLQFYDENNVNYLEANIFNQRRSFGNSVRCIKD